MSVEFFRIPETDEFYRNQVEQFQSSCVKTGLSTNDEFWRNLIFGFLFKYYNSHTSKKKEFSSKKEDDIKKCIYDWLNQDLEFCGSTLIVNLETRTEGTQLGYEDMKFQTPFWGNEKKHFIFECKPLDNSTAKIKEYVYRPKTMTKTADGGLYRFLINKYATDQNFGGMIGFIQQGNIEVIIKNIKSAIRNLKLTDKNGQGFGQILNPDLLDQTIYDNKNTFHSNHVRCDKDTNTIISSIHIYHILFDFTTN